MSKNYISVDRSDYLLKQIISYKSYDEIGEKLKDAIYANLKEIEKMGFDEIFNSLGSAEKLLEDLKNHDFIYKSKTSSLVLSLMNKFTMTDMEMKKIKDIFDKLFDEYKNVVKRKNGLLRDISFEIYNEYKDIKYKEIDWGKVGFYVPNDKKIRDMNVSIDLIKEIGFLVNCDELRDFNVSKLGEDPKKNSHIKNKILR